MTDEDRGRQRRWRRGKTNDPDSSPIQILIAVGGGGGGLCVTGRVAVCVGEDDQVTLHPPSP